MKVRRISIFFPRENAFYTRLLGHMVQGFNDIGIVANGRCALLGESELHDWISEYKPDVIFEMNRVGCELPIHDLGVKHVSWVVDFGGRDQSHIRGSDIIYYFDPGGVTSTLADCHTAWLAPGACTKHYYPSDIAFDTDFLFVGHIPAPWSEEELNTLIGALGAKQLLFSELLEEYLTGQEQPFDTPPTHKTLKDRIRGIVEKKVGEATLSRKVEYDLLERTNRLNSRHQLVGAAASIGAANISIYGSDTWSQWPEYNKYFRGFLSNTEMLRRVYSTSRYCLHDGVGMHFRSMDCMASGGVILYRQDQMFKYPLDDKFSHGIHTSFEEGRHYLKFNSREDLSNIHQRFKRDDAGLRRIGASAAVAIRDGHTWRHRAQRIVDDIKMFA